MGQRVHREHVLEDRARTVGLREHAGVGATLDVVREAA